MSLRHSSTTIMAITFTTNLYPQTTIRTRAFSTGFSQTLVDIEGFKYARTY
jgi:hypothetical protein